MRLTVADQEKMLTWAAKMLGTTGWSADSTAFGIVEPREGQRPLLRGVVIANAFFNKSCRIHIASDGSRKWATRDVLTRLSAFLHLQHGVNRIATVIATKNLPAQIAALKIGFQIEGRERSGADDGTDGIRFSMLRDENPWLNDEEAESHG
jgi:RimJ/RimL family protein N-acetyltransferase